MKNGMKAVVWRVLLALLATAPWSTGVVGLHGVGVDVPGAVLVGETITLGCQWTLDDEEALYSVKWYRGREEFYRYIPKELPHTRVFPQAGIDVDISLSGARRVVLRGATPALAGRYRCEVSADAPTFHTEIRSAPLLVVEPPEWSPQLTSERAWYGVGHTLRATCVTPPSSPPANITVMLNGELLEVESYSNKIPEGFKWTKPHSESTTPPPQLVDVEGAADIISDDSTQYLDVPGDSRDYDLRPQASALHQHLEIPAERLPAVGVVSFVVQSDSFVGGALQLTCVANIYNVWAARDHLVFHSEQPEVASVLGVRNSASDGASGIIGHEILLLSVLLFSKLR